MTAIVTRDARASLLLDVVASVPSGRRASAQDYSLFDQIAHGRAASDYSRSRSAKRTDLCRKALCLLAIVWL